MAVSSKNAKRSCGGGFHFLKNAKVRYGWGLILLKWQK